jgi:Histone deacetylase domain
MGFCLFDNVAIAADLAGRELGVARVLIIVWDFHHGNGTEFAPQLILISNPYFSASHRCWARMPGLGRWANIGA